MTRSASVQTVHLSIEHIDEDVVYLSGEQYRAVLEAGSVNFGLQGEAEQEVVIAGFARALNALSYPIQVLVRVLPIDLDQYLGDIEGRTRGLSDALADLSQEYVSFLRRLARNRALLERRFYVVVPAGTEAASARPWPLRQGRPSADLEAARRQLTFRTEEVQRQLIRCGLPSRRLKGAELIRLYFACWCPDLARVQRLGSELGSAESLVVAARGRQTRRA
jgi:hypothetical protein